MYFFVYDFWPNWNLEMLIFEERGKRKNLTRQKARANNKLNTHSVDAET